jgi:biopolymer transport protein ExbD
MNLNRFRKSDAEAGIELAPLIDMVFILLIFFMVTTTFVKDHQIDLQRPTAASATRSSTKSLRVTVDRNGGAFVDGEPVRPWVLQNRVRQLLDFHPEGQVLVIADRQLESGKLVEVVDQIRLAGARDVGVATDREMGE